MSEILYITNAFDFQGGGLVGACSGLAQALKKIYSAPAVAAFGVLPNEAASWQGIECHEINARKLLGIHWGGDLYEYMGRASPAIIHVHGIWLRSSAENHRWCKRHSVPYIVSPHGMLDPWAVRNSKWKKKLAGIWFENKHLRDAAVLHALCDSEADAMRAYGLCNRIEVIPNGVDLPDESAELPPPPWPATDRKTLLFMGRLHPKKGLSELLDAWTRVQRDLDQRSSREWQLVIAGWGAREFELALRHALSEQQISDSVTFVGPVHGKVKASCLRHSSGFILPSFSEGLPMAVLEAWSYNLPVLITEECNLPEGFEANAALKCEANPDAVESALREFFKMSDYERNTIGRNGFDLAAQRFSWDKIASDMKSIYQELLSR